MEQKSFSSEGQKPIDPDCDVSPEVLEMLAAAARAARARFVMPSDPARKPSAETPVLQALSDYLYGPDEGADASEGIAG